MAFKEKYYIKHKMKINNNATEWKYVDTLRM